MGRRLLTWMDLPRLVLLVGFFRIAAFLPLTDPDYFWHLETGRWILSHETLPAVDMFSFTRDGAPWVLHEWLFQVVLALMHGAFGDAGVRILTAVLATGALALSLAIAQRLFRAPFATAILLAGLLFAFDPFLAPRPQLVSFLLFAAFLHLLLRWKFFGQERGLWLMPPLMLIWANAHGGFPVGLLLLITFAAGEWLEWISAPVRDPQGRRRLIRIASVAVVSLLASGLTPYLWRGWVYPFATLSMQAASTMITEWRSPDFHDRHFQVYLLTLMLLFVLSVHRRRRPGPTEMLLAVLFPGMGFFAVRHVAFPLLTLPPLLASALVQGAAAELAAIWERSGLRARYRAGVERSGELGDREFVINWALAGAVGGAFMTGHPQAMAVARDVGREMPVKSVDYVVRNRIEGRMFNTYHYGGYLLYRLYPHQRVFIDGRADVFGDDLIRDYHTIYTGGAKWAELFDKYRFDYVVVEHDAAIRQLLLARGDFELAQDDKVSSVLVRRGVFAVPAQTPAGE